MADSSGPLVVTMTRGSPGPTGVNGKKQKSRLENILFKLKKADQAEETLRSTPSPDPSSQGSGGDLTAGNVDGHLGQRDSAEIPAVRDSMDGHPGQSGSSSSNRRSSRKPTRWERGSASVDHANDSVSEVNDGGSVERGDHDEHVTADSFGGEDRNEGDSTVMDDESDSRPDFVPVRVKVEKEDDNEDWPGFFRKTPAVFPVEDMFPEQDDDIPPSDDTFTCDRCGDVFPSLHELDTHIDTHIKQEIKDFNVYPCNICGKSFASEGYLSRHMATHNTEEAQVEEEEELPLDEQAYDSDGMAKPTRRCEQCRRLFNTEDDFQQHNCRKGMLRPFGCGRCGRAYSHLPILKSHLTLHERDLTADLECYQCGQKFMYSIELRRHMSVHIKADLTATLISPSSTKLAAPTSTSTSETTPATPSADSAPSSRAQASLKLRIPYSRLLCKKKVRKRTAGALKVFTCHLCKKVFHRRNYLNMHMRVHGERRFECSYCSKKFTYKKSLEIHVRSHTGEKPYQCSLCTKSFARQDSLHKHEKIHLGVKPYVCETCGRQYGDRFELQRHALSHSQEKPFKCSMCTKAYTDKKRLKEHMFFHSGDLPFICDLCGKGFARKYRYNQHLSQHAGEVRFHCQFCSRGFYRRSDLNSHLETHSNKKPHICNVCGAGFLRESYLRRHMIVHSGEKPHQCSVCGKGFSRKNTLRRHLLIHKRKDAGTEEDFTEASSNSSMSRYREGADRYREGADRYREGADRYRGGADRYREHSRRYRESTDRYGNYTADFGYGISGHVAPVIVSNAEERDIMKDIQAVIGLGDDVAVFD